MIGYDFDDTIFTGNSYRRFYAFCLLRFPYLILLLPCQIIALILFVLHVIPRDKLIGWIERFVLFVPHLDKQVDKFWNKNIHRVKQWYLDKQQPTDLVISASPYYLIKPACDRLHITDVIATQVDVRTGKMTDVYAYGQGKVTLYNKYYNVPLQEYYSDSLSDSPILNYAQTGYLVKGDKISPFKNK